jgi:glycosyltransferase involved in cell wall biosynthesis
LNVSIAIVIPTFNNLDELRACLDAIPLGGASPSVLVAVDGSTDGTIEYLRSSRLPFSVRVLEHDDRANHGRARARNLALPFLDAEFTLFLDSDMRLEPGAIATHLNLLSRRECVSIGDVMYMNASDNLWARYLGTRGHNKAMDGAVIRPLDFHTANVAMRTSDVLALGGFDESLTGYGGEDTEFGLRVARQLGRPLVYNAQARATTVEPKTVDAGLAQLRRYATTNLHAILRKHPDAPAPFWIDRLDSPRLRNRLMRLMLNPLTDLVVNLALPVTPFAIQRRLLNYKVIRAVFSGYQEGPA